MTCFLFLIKKLFNNKKIIKKNNFFLDNKKNIFIKYNCN